MGLLAGAAWPGLRVDAPGRLPYQRGKLPDLDTEEARQVASEEFTKDVLAASSRGPAEARSGA